jgi:murein DD-endopeptidase MepM/ murein hydrolase activator NlpD
MQKKVSAAVIVVSVAAVVSVWSVMNTWNADRDESSEVLQAESESIVKPIIKYGLDISDFIIENHVIKQNELFSDILTEYKVGFNTINFLANQSKDIFNIRKMRVGNNCALLCQKTDSGLVAKKMIYEESKVDYVVFNLDDSLYIYRAQNNIERKRMEVSGIIRSSLYETLDENDLNPALAVRMADIFAWSVDFYKIQQGDKFKIIFDQDFVNGKSINVGEIQAIVFNNGGKDFYAFYYEKDKEHEGDYYDEQGNSMKKMFLKAPVKFSRISSGYSLNRFHPVTKEWKAHLGTDYAAPYGTPILATADGVIEEAQFKIFNGNYVKIRHNGEYKTQYLHMSKIGKGIRPGVRVKQGSIIGYVGSTGLATGPHVCYRFWKDGSQVDPLKQKLTFAEPLPAKYRSNYLAQIKSVRDTLDGISYERNIAVQKKEKLDKIAAQSGALAFVQRIF